MRITAFAIAAAVSLAGCGSKPGTDDAATNGDAAATVAAAQGGGALGEPQGGVGAVDATSPLPAPAAAPAATAPGG